MGPPTTTRIMNYSRDPLGILYNSTWHPCKIRYLFNSFNLKHPWTVLDSIRPLRAGGPLVRRLFPAWPSGGIEKELRGKCYTALSTVVQTNNGNPIECNIKSKRNLIGGKNTNDNVNINTYLYIHYTDVLAECFFLILFISIPRRRIVLFITAFVLYLSSNI